MSTFEPMSEEEIRAWWAGGGLCAERMAKTALHHLARAKAAEERVDRSALGEILGWSGEETLTTAARRVVAERDAARAERDASVVWLKNTLAEVRADLGHHDSMRHEVARAAGMSDATAATWSDVVAKVALLAAELTRLRAEVETLNGQIDAVTVERDEAYRQRDAAKERADDHLALIRDARTILGATDGEMLSDAARRVAKAVESTYPGPQVLREILGAEDGQGVIPAARAVMAELTRLREGRDGQVRAANEEAARARDAMQRMKAEHAGALAVARMDAAEAEPAQTFHPPIAVRISRTPGRNGWLRADVDVDDITDPAFLALTGEQYARLALVVTR